MKKRELEEVLFELLERVERLEDQVVELGDEVDLLWSALFVEHEVA